MAAVTTPFTLSGTLTFPPDDGEPNADRDFSQLGNFTQKTEFIYALVGAGTKVVDFGSIVAAGAKAILVKVGTGAGVAPINLLLNGGSDPLEVAPGGFFVLGSPVPVDGVLALSIAHTTNVRVVVFVLG